MRPLRSYSVRLALWSHVWDSPSGELSGPHERDTQVRSARRSLSRWPGVPRLAGASTYLGDAPLSVVGREDALGRAEHGRVVAQRLGDGGCVCGLVWQVLPASKALATVHRHALLETKRGRTCAIGTHVGLSAEHSIQALRTERSESRGEVSSHSTLPAHDRRAFVFAVPGSIIPLKPPPRLTPGVADSVFVVAFSHSRSWHLGQGTLIVRSGSANSGWRR